MSDRPFSVPFTTLAILICSGIIGSLTAEGLDAQNTPVFLVIVNATNPVTQVDNDRLSRMFLK